MTGEEPIRTVAGYLRISNQLLEGGEFIPPKCILQTRFVCDPLADARRRWGEALEPWPAKLRRRVVQRRRTLQIRSNEARESVALRVAPWLLRDDDY